MNTPRWNTANVKEWLAENKPGFELIGEYVYTPGVSPKITVICPEGHVRSIFWYSFKSSTTFGCQICKIDNRRIPYNDVRSRFIEAGCTLLSPIYVNANSPLTYICANGHTATTTWGSFTAGHGCITCAARDTSARLTIPLTEIIQFLTEHDIDLIGPYINVTTPTTFSCPAEHIYTSTIQKIKISVLTGGSGCKQCSILKQLGPLNSQWKGGTTPLSQKIRSSPQAQSWRSSVFCRDGYKCVICANGGHLRAHHLESFAKNPDLRFELGNGVTMCSLCHDVGRLGSFHTLYTAFNNTRTQFGEYLVLRGVNINLPIPTPTTPMLGEPPIPQGGIGPIFSPIYPL